MKNILIIFLLALVISSCKDKEEDPVVIDAEIVGTWKRVSYVTISGTDSSFSNYSENIYHYYNSNGDYDETKTASSGYTVNANYEFSYSNDILKLFSLGDLVYEYPAVITGNTMIIDLEPDGSTKYSYKLQKQ